MKLWRSSNSYTFSKFLSCKRFAFGITILSRNISVTPYFATSCCRTFKFFLLVPFHNAAGVFFFCIINKMIFLHKHFCLLIFLFLKKIHKFDKFNYEITFYIMRLCNMYIGVGGEYITLHSIIVL